MGEKSFNRKDCIRALKRLGFVLRNRRHGSHDKYCPPDALATKLLGMQPRFIMVPRHNELRCQTEILAELKAMGSDDLVAEFKKYL